MSYCEKVIPKLVGGCSDREEREQHPTLKPSENYLSGKLERLTPRSQGKSW